MCLWRKPLTGLFQEGCSMAWAREQRQVGADQPQEAGDTISPFLLLVALLLLEN